MVKNLRTVLVLAVSAAVVAGAAPPAVSAPSGPTGAGTPTAVAGLAETVRTITLITGDVVQLTTFPDGRQEAAVDYARTPGRHGFQLSKRDGDLYLMPDDALPYVTSGQLDPTLFNLTDLVADGYYDAASQSLPLLISGAPATTSKQRAVPSTPTGATRQRELRSIGAVAVSEDKAHARDFWRALANGPRTLSSGVGRIWLDRKVRADLADSVPQIGAPTAWRAGYDGTGVKVAVLDSGYDPHHPDLTGRVTAEANFTTESGADDVTDRIGHGTHVAATIAGRGPAKPGPTAGQNGGADPRLGGTGVAPGANLVIGKVLDGTGSGQLSEVIAGMEWAVAQGAKVINVSLGTKAYENSDPATEAVDALTASSGALFVISAGNMGPGIQTLGTPGIASAALTVGAVSKADEIADFSSRGPRLGDGMVKPEITAPGVGIIAARAAGTTLGEVVNGSYTSMSGTSMAAPHVAGAAALVAQRHPDWRAEQLKAALVSTATNPNDAKVWEQGAGRVDVPAALDQQVSTDTASISLGRIPAGSPAQTATVTYRNTGKRAVTLTLAGEASEVGGATARRAALTVSPAQLTIPAGKQASATVRVDPAATAANLYGGLLTARGDGQELRTPIGFNVIPPTHTLTIEAVDRDGLSPRGFGNKGELWNLDTGEMYYAFFFEGAPAATVELPAGRYALMTYILSVDPGGTPKDVTMLGEPELTITGDRTLRYDARTATEITIDTPDRATMSQLGLSWQRTTPNRSLLTGMTYHPGQVRRAYATPTRPVSIGTFQFFTRWDLIAPSLTAEVPGAGGRALHEPQLLDFAPPLDGQHTLRLVDGGNGTPAELAAAGVRDAAVLLRFTTTDAVREQLQAAAEAGARLVFLAPDTPGYFLAAASGATIPAYAITAEDGQALRERLGSGPVSIALTGVARTPFRYDLLLTEPGQVPTDLHYTVDDLRLATVDSEFHRYGPGMSLNETRAGFADGVNVAFSFQHRIGEAQRRTDYVNTRGVSWRSTVVADGVSADQSVGSMFGAQYAYQAGQRSRQVWFPALLRPAVPKTVPNYAAGIPANRSYDAIRVAVPQYANGDVSQYGWVDNRYDQSELTLRQGNTVLGRSSRSAEQFTVPAEAGEYRLTLDVTRKAADDQAGRSTSTATSTTWTFHSRRPKIGEPAVLPLPQIGYDIETDLTNTVPAAQPYPLVLRPGYQPGAEGPGRFTVDVQVSYDDGAHWQRAATNGSTEVTATVPAAPAGAAFATVRVTARDHDGNRIEQTITRAWRVTA